MTVNATTTLSAPQAADGLNRTWYFPFKIVADDQIILYLLNPDNVETRVTSGYSVVGVGSDSGGEVTYPLEPTAPLAFGISVRVGRLVVYEQPDRLGNQGPYLPRIIEGAFDRLEMQIQQLAENISRAPLYPVSPPPPPTVAFPPPDPGHVLIWDENGNLVNSATDVAAFETSAINAQAAAEIAMAMAASASDAAAAAAGVAGGIAGPVGGEWPLTAFGAKGDGITDDLTAIQNAVNSGEKLLATRGVYLIDGSITISPANNGLSLRGMGMDGATTFKSADFAHAPVITFFGGTGSTPILDVHLSEFKIDGNKDFMTDGQSGSRGIYMSGGGTVQRRFHFHRIWMDKVLDQGFNVGGGPVQLSLENTDSLVDYCMATNGGRETHLGAGGLGGSGFTGGGFGLKLHKCVSDGNYLAGFKFAGLMDSCIARNCGGGYSTGSISANTEMGPHYINCVSEYNGSGWYIRGQSDKIVFQGCIARWNDTHGMMIGDDTRTVIIGGGTRIYNNGQLNGITAPVDSFGGWNGIMFQSGSVGGPIEVFIDDTMIYDNQAVRTQDYAIFSPNKALRCTLGPGCIINEQKIAKVYRTGTTHSLRIKGFDGSPVQSTAPFIGNAVTALVSNPFSVLLNSRVVTVAHTAHGRAINDYVLIGDRSKPVDTLANPFSMTSGSAVVTITYAAHGAVVGETVEIRGAVTAGGILIFGNYLVASVPTVDTITITHSAPATSTVVGGGSTVQIAFRSLVGGLHIAGRFRIQSVPNANSYTIWHEANAAASGTGGGLEVTANYATIGNISVTGNAGVAQRIASYVIPPAFLVQGSKFKVVVTGAITGTACVKEIGLGTGTAAGASGRLSLQTAGQALNWWGEGTFVCEAGNSVRGLIVGGHTGSVPTTASTQHTTNIQTNPLNIIVTAVIDAPATDTVTITSFSISADE